MARFRPEFHSTLTKRFVDDVYYKRKTLYISLGMVYSWGEISETITYDPDNCGCNDCKNKVTIANMQFGDNTNPHKDPGDEPFHETTLRDNIVYLSKITSNDVCLVVNCKKWSSGNTYDQWDHMKDMKNPSNPVYCYNSDYQVYKCISNGNTIVDRAGFNEQPDISIPLSTVEPKGVNYDVFEAGDGYIWKYMYTIPLALRNRFMTSTMIPVQKAVDVGFYNNGGIEEVIINSRGSGFSSEKVVTAVIDPGEDQMSTDTAKVALGINQTTGSIESVVITNQGDGYPDGSKQLTIIDKKHTGTAKYPNGFNGETHSGAVLIGYFKDGHLDDVVVEDCGVGYSADLATSAIITGDGTGAKGYPIVDNGEIVGFVITNGGSNYSYADIKFVSAGLNSEQQLSLVQPSVTVRIGGSADTTDQSVVEQTAIPGAIYAIQLTQAGTGYNRGSTTVTITGDGTGAKAHVVFDKGLISKIVVDDCGSGYTYANVVVTDQTRAKGSNRDCQAYAILPPIGGHGSNAVTEMFANTAALYLQIKNNTELSDLNQEFRQFTILEDLRNISDNSLANDQHELSLFNVTIVTNNNNNVATKDGILIDNNKVKYRIINKVENTWNLQQLSYLYHDIGKTLTFTDDNGKQYIYEIQSVESTPKINKYSGSLLYSSNNAPFYLSDNKSFGIKTYIKF